MELVLILTAFAAVGAREIPPGMKVNSRPEIPHTSFQTPTGYIPEHDIRTDAVIVYSSLPDRIASWKQKGYVTQTMYGFRTGPDYIEKHPEEGQTLADGQILTCGPGSYYMVPTQSRINAALEYFRAAIDAGTEAVIPEEPEFFSQAGYSESFKKEWEGYYNSPWEDQTSSINARWKSDRLKGYLERRMVESILKDAESRKPEVTRAVAAHSAVTYYSWGIIYPHYEVMKLPALQEMIGQVWTGTARSPCKYEGITAERTFENGYLEYSSLWNLMRDTGKRLWFLMDPLEDNPDRTMGDYETNYEKTLVASLMFPGVDEYEVMPWPERIFGRVPPEFATKIMTIVTMLGDMHNQHNFNIDAGTQGIATFVADSMAWQRGEPHPSNFDSFYGLTLPLLMKGIPVQVAQLERTSEPKYLNSYEILLVSYDALKPTDEAYNNALADWVKKGGTLILFGGTDAYNDLPEWWNKKGYRSPKEHLLAELGIKVRQSASLVFEDRFQKLLAEERQCRMLENRKSYVLDVSNYVLDGRIYVKFQDVFKGDGWGPSVFRVELRVDGQTVDSFKVGTKEEQSHIYLDGGSIFNGTARFADGTAFWVYEFDTACSKKSVIEPRVCCTKSPWKPRKVELVLDMGNQFLVSVAVEKPLAKRSFRGVGRSSLVKQLKAFEVPSTVAVTAYDVDATPMYYVEGTRLCPFFEKKVGAGNVIFVGISPAYFAASKEGADILRSIARYGCERAGIHYEEKGYMMIRRGRYVAVRTFEKPVTFKGRFINVLDSHIPIVENPKVLADELAVLADVNEMLTDKWPRLMLSSSRLEASSEEENFTSLLLSGPLKTKGIARLSTAGKQVDSILVENSSGEPVPFEQEAEGSTLVVTYNDDPEGVLVKVKWR